MTQRTNNTATSLYVPDLKPATSALDAANAYAKGGLWLVPVRPGTKHPGSYLGKSWPSRSVRSGADIWCVFGEDYPDAGIGIHAGRSGLVIVDVDNPAALPDVLRRAIVETKPPFQTTRRAAPDTDPAALLARGELRGHAVFAMPAGRMLGNSLGKLPKGWGDIRGANGFIVVAPSLHPSEDGCYRWIRTGAIPELPGYVAELLPDGGEHAEAVATTAQVKAFLAEHTGRARPGAAKTPVAKFRAEIDNGGGRHQEALTAAVWICREARAGLYPAGEPLAELKNAFIAAVEKDPGAHATRRNRQGILAEFQGIVAWAIGQALGEAPERLAEVRERAAEQADSGKLPANYFTDASLADVIADEALANTYCWTSALGWLHYDGTRWAPVEDGQVIEAVRQYVLSRYQQAFAEDLERIKAGKDSDDFETTGWRKMQSASRLAAVLKLASGIAGILRDASTFDADPDLLNTPAGVVDLRTGEVMPHDPQLLMTKITDVGYVPGAESAAFKAALAAVPDGCTDWLQLRLGQAATGRSTDQLVLLTGCGSNGKTALMGAIFRTLGSYAGLVPNTLLLRGKSVGGPTEEKMTLRGVRLAYMEETPEDGFLDSQVVKELIDAEEIQGRHCYKASVTWKPTHSIFLNTNHPPVVGDTGDGTWRRLARVDFPYRFRKSSEALERPEDRHGDPQIKNRLASAEARQAILAWLIEGAIAVYAAGSLDEAETVPQPVLASVRKWREDSDDVLRFVGACLELDADRWVSSDHLYRAYADWARDNGHRAMSSREFVKRVNGHSALPGWVAHEKIRTSRPGLSRPSAFWGQEAIPEQTKVFTGLKFIAK